MLVNSESEIMAPAATHFCDMVGLVGRLRFPLHSPSPLEILNNGLQRTIELLWLHAKCRD